MAFSAKNIKIALETAYSKTHILVMLLVAFLFIWIGIYVYRNYVGSYLGSHIEGYAANIGDDARKTIRRPSCLTFQRKKKRGARNRFTGVKNTNSYQKIYMKC